MNYILIVVCTIVLCYCINPTEQNETKESQLGLLWSYDTQNGSNPKAEPTMDNGSIFVTGGLGLHKVSLNDGSRIWYSPTEGATSSLLNYRFIYNENVIIGLKPNYIVGFDKISGSIRWETHIADSTFLLDIGMGAKYENTAYYTSSTYGYIIAIDIDSGEIEWLHKFPFYLRNINVFENGDLLIPHEEVHSEEPYVYTAVMGRWRPSTKEWIWRYRVDGNGTFSVHYPQIENNVVYSGLTGSGFLAIDATTGQEIWKTIKTGLITGFHVLTPDTIYAQARNRVYALNRHTGELLWETTPMGISESTRIHYKNGYVYWGHANGIFIYDAQTGKQVLYQQHEGGGSIQTSTINEKNYFVQTNRYLLAYELYSPEE